MRFRQGSFGLALALLVCLLFAGIVLGRGKVAPSPAVPSSGQPVAVGQEDPSAVQAAQDPKASASDLPRDGAVAEDHVAPSRGSDSSIQVALASVSVQLVELWQQVAGRQEGVDEEGAAKGPGVLAEVPIWGGATARVRTTYDVVDLDQLRESVASRNDGPKDSVVGVSGEVSFGDVASIRIGYGLRPSSDTSDQRYVGVADAEVAYRLGNRATVGADVTWGVGSETEHAASLSVSYQLAPNTSLRAGYRMLNFGDVDGTREQRDAAAGIQLRF